MSVVRIMMSDTYEKKIRKAVVLCKYTTITSITELKQVQRATLRWFSQNERYLLVLAEPLSELRFFLFFFKYV